MDRITLRDQDMKALKWEVILDGACSMNWCRNDRNGRSHMQSPRIWHEAQASFVKFPGQFGTTRRMIRLAGDWALLADPDTKAAVQHFAQDQDSFFNTFGEAFGKLMERGATSGQLLTCEASQPPDMLLPEEPGVLRAHRVDARRAFDNATYKSPQWWDSRAKFFLAHRKYRDAVGQLRDAGLRIR